MFVINIFVRSLFASLENYVLQRKKLPFNENFHVPSYHMVFTAYFSEYRLCKTRCLCIAFIDCQTAKIRKTTMHPNA